MKKLTKYGALAGLALSLAPLAARAEDMMTSTDTTAATDAANTAATTATSTAAAAAFGGIAIVMMIVWFVLVVVGILLFVFWIFMIIDVFKRTNWKQESDKTLWIILVILLGYIGAIVYYFAVKRQLDPPKKK